MKDKICYLRYAIFLAGSSLSNHYFLVYKIYKLIRPFLNYVHDMIANIEETPSNVIIFHH